MNLCNIGHTKLQDGGIYFICEKTGNHCDEFTRWCSQTEKYEPKGDCLECLIKAQSDKDNKNIEKQLASNVVASEDSDK